MTDADAEAVTSKPYGLSAADEVDETSDRHRAPAVSPEVLSPKLAERQRQLQAIGRAYLEDPTRQVEY